MQKEEESTCTSSSTTTGGSAGIFIDTPHGNKPMSMTTGRLIPLPVAFRQPVGRQLLRRLLSTGGMSAVMGIGGGGGGGSMGGGSGGSGKRSSRRSDSSILTVASFSDPLDEQQLKAKRHVSA
jgi:hypothetical protein